MLQGAEPQPAALPHARRERPRSPRAPPRRAGRTCPTREVLAASGSAAEADRPLGELTPATSSWPRSRSRWPRGPALLLADEPTSQLDHAARDRVLERVAGSTASSAPRSCWSPTTPTSRTRLPRTVTIRDGRVGGEGRSGEEYAVVTRRRLAPAAAHVREDLPPGTLVRFHPSTAPLRPDPRARRSDR